MTRRVPISVFIIAFDEADRIEKPIASVRDWADEIIVIDSGSTDGTQDLARWMSDRVRVIFNPWPGYGPQKIFGERQCRNSWLLNLDADEELDDELSAAIRRLFADGVPDCAGFALRRRMIHFADDRPRRLAPVTSYIRLYDKGRAGYRDSIVHDAVVVREGAIEALAEGAINHRSFRSFEHFRAKLDEYANWQARDMFERARCPGNLRHRFEPVFAFAKHYLARRAFIYGRDGITMSLDYARVRRNRLLRARALFAENRATGA